MQEIVGYKRKPASEAYSRNRQRYMKRYMDGWIQFEWIQ